MASPFPQLPEAPLFLERAPDPGTPRVSLVFIFKPQGLRARYLPAGYRTATQIRAKGCAQRLVPRLYLLSPSVNKYRFRPAVCKQGTKACRVLLRPFRVRGCSAAGSVRNPRLSPPHHSCQYLNQVNSCSLAHHLSLVAAELFASLDS